MKAVLGTVNSHTAAPASVFAGTVLTYWLNNVQGLGPILSSSVTCVVSALLLPEKLALASVCGSFAGMAKPTVIESSTYLGLMCAFMMALFDKQKWLIGVGGRLGFIAQCACTSLFLIVTAAGSPPKPPAALYGKYPDVTKLLSGLPSVCTSTTVGALFMSFWKEFFANLTKKDYNEAVRPLFKRLSTSSAAVGVTGLLAAAFLKPSLAGAAFCGSFIAMSSPARLETYGALIGASIVGGLSQQMLAGVLLGGWGGKLGAGALFGVLGCMALTAGSKLVVGAR